MRRRKKHRTFTNEIDQYIYKLLHEGYSIPEIAKIVNISFGNLRSHITDYGGRDLFHPDLDLGKKLPDEFVRKVKSGRNNDEIKIIDEMIEWGDYKINNIEGYQWFNKDCNLYKQGRCFVPPLHNNVIAILLRVPQYKFYRSISDLNKPKDLEGHLDLPLFKQETKEEVKPYSYTEMQGEIEALKMHINILYDLIQNKGNNDVRSVTNTRN